MKTISYEEYRKTILTPKAWAFSIIGLIAAVLPILLAFGGFFGSISTVFIFLYFGFLGVGGVLMQFGYVFYCGYIKQIYYSPEKSYLMASRYKVFVGEEAKRAVRLPLISLFVIAIIFAISDYWSYLSIR